jgi:hypothetical protein
MATMVATNLFRTRQMSILALALVLALAGCGGADVRPEMPGDAGSATDSETGPETGSETRARDDTPNPDCIPGDVEGNPIVQPDRRHEDIIFYLTGERQTGDLDPVEETIDDPNFGGVWGDRAGGIVVAVLDCSAVDADEIAHIAGGPQYLHLIEVSHTFREVTEFRDELRHELNAIGIHAELLIDSTLTGRHITVQLPDPSVLPSDFGSGVPDHLFSIAEGELFVEQ